MGTVLVSEALEAPDVIWSAVHLIFIADMLGNFLVATRDDAGNSSTLARRYSEEAGGFTLLSVWRVRVRPPTGVRVPLAEGLPPKGQSR